MLVDVKNRIYFLLKYEWRLILYFFFVSYFFQILYLIFQGNFVRLVEYKGYKVNYLKFLFVSMISVLFYKYSWKEFWRKRIKREMMFEIFLLRRFSTLLTNIILVTVNHILFIPLYLFLGLEVGKILLLILVSLSFLLHGVLLSIFVLSLSLIIKGSDLRPITMLLSDVIGVLLPISYSVFQIIPKEFEFLLYLFPPSFMLEGIRELILFGNNAIFLRNFIRYIISTVPFGFFVKKFFDISFEKSRRSGLICLE